MFCVLRSRSWHVFLLRSRGMSVAAPSVVGVSQLLLSDSTLRECELLRFFNFRRLAMNPLSGELRPMLESRGRSAGRGQSRAVKPLSRGELQLLWRLMGEKRPQSAVRGVVRVGVESRPSPWGTGVVRGSGVFSESKSLKSLGDLRAARPPVISLNSLNFGVLRDSFGVVRMSLLGDIRLASLMAWSAEALSSLQPGCGNRTQESAQLIQTQSASFQTLFHPLQDLPNSI